MKTKIISKLKKEILVIETPLNVKDVIFNKGDNSLTWETEHLIISGYDLDGYTLLGKPDEIKEEDAKAFVDKTIPNGFTGSPTPYKWYRDYTEPINSDLDYPFLNATESILSALESEIYWNVNPLGTEPNHIDYKFEKYKGEYHFKSESHKSRYGNAYEKWQQAEFDTFNKNRTLIFVKN